MTGGGGSMALSSTAGPETRAGLTFDVGLRQGHFVLDVALQAGTGRTVAVVGPNGAGKTTLLRALAGLVRLDRGRVEIGNRLMEDVYGGTRLPPDQRPVGMVFQDLLLFPHLDVLDNVAYGLRRRRSLPKREARGQAGPWLDRLALAPLAHRRPAELSGGEAQRVALARALATEPELLLLDEPLSALDASARPAARELLAAHLAGITAVRLLVTHDAGEAAALADQVVVLEAGRVVQQGTAAELRASPASPYVADLVDRR